MTERESNAVTDEEVEELLKQFDDEELDPELLQQLIDFIKDPSRKDARQYFNLSKEELEQEIQKAKEEKQEEKARALEIALLASECAQRFKDRGLT